MNRIEWKAFSHSVREDAAKRMRDEGHDRKTFSYSLRHNGALYCYRFEREYLPRQSTFRNTGHIVFAACLVDRPRRSLAADALSWAARYRRDFKRTRHAIHLAAHAACIREARDFGSAFARLP